MAASRVFMDINIGDAAAYAELKAAYDRTLAFLAEARGKVRVCP